MASVSGNTGKVTLDTNDVAKVLLWTADIVKADFPQVHSDGAPATNRVMGNEDITGSFQIEAPDGAIPTAIRDAIINGTTVTLELITNKTAGAKTYTGPAKIMQAPDVGADINSGETINHTYNFGMDGAWTYPTG